MAFANDRTNVGWHKSFEETSQRPQLPSALTQPHPATEVYGHGDPHAALVWTVNQEPHRVLLGLGPTGFNLSAPRRNVAFLGAPRSNKTASVVTTASAYFGPLFAVTTRRHEFAQAIGHARARIAGPDTELIHIDLDGGTALNGWSPRGWTPVTAHPRTAYSRAKAMTEAYEMGSVNNGSFWAVQATDVLYPLLLAAGLGGMSIEWVRATAKTGRRRAIDLAISYLEEAHSQGTLGMKEACDSLLALDEMAPETKGSVLATAGGALSAYTLPEAVAATKRPAVDLEALIKGQLESANPFLYGYEYAPDGCFGTVLVTGSSAQQRLLRPIVVGITADLRDICFRVADADIEDSVTSRRSTLTILDDMPTLAPDRDLPATLAQSGGQNLLVCGIYHDDAQLRAQWGEEGAKHGDDVWRAARLPWSPRHQDA